MAITKIGGLNIDSNSDITIQTLLCQASVDSVTTPTLKINQSSSDSQIYTSNSAGDDQSSISLIIASGKSTGSAHPGDIIFKLSPAGAAGNTLNPYVIKGLFGENETVQLSSGQSVFSLENGTSLRIKDSGGTEKFSVLASSGSVFAAGSMDVDTDLDVGNDLDVVGNVSIGSDAAADTFVVDAITTLNGNVTIAANKTLTIDGTQFPRFKTTTETGAATLDLNTISYINQSAPITLTLPTASTGDWVYIVCNDTTSYNNVTVAGTVFGDSGGLILDTTFATAQLVYLNGTVGWIAINV